MKRPLDRFEPINLRRDVHGAPINFPVLLDEDGEQTGDIDWVIEARVLYGRRCGVCGDPLGETCYFIGTIEDAVRRLFYTPALHLGCARYAFGRCPFLAAPQFSSQDTDAERNGEPVALYETTGYRIFHLRFWFRLFFGQEESEWGRPIVRVAPGVWERIGGRKDLIEKLER